MNQAVLECLRTRRSVRKYRKEQISDEELRLVLEAGTWAPTAHGKQDPWIVAVQREDLMARLVKLNAEVLGSTGNPYYDAPTIVLVFGSQPEVWKNSVQDGSLVLGNMMNAAHAIGLGSCWINREMEMFSLPEGKALMKDLGVPEELMGIGALALGYADGEPREAKPRKEGYCRVIR